MIEITVDENPIAPGQFEMHSQAEPFPGGSTYRIVIQDSALTTTLSDTFAKWQGAPLSAQQAARLFNLLRMYISLKSSRDKPVYWANTVENIQFRGDLLEVKGICSPHVG